MNNVIYLAGRDQPANVLMVEREPLMRSRTAAYLRKAGFLVMEAVDGEEVLKILRAGQAVRVVLGDIDHGFATNLLRDFPKVIAVIGIAGDAAFIPQIRLSSVRRPYDLPEVERIVKTLLAGTRTL